MNNSVDCMATYLREIQTNVLVIVRNFRSRICLNIIHRSFVIESIRRQLKGRYKSSLDIYGQSVMEDPNFSEPMIYKADLVLHSGILNGLSILKRHNNATLTYIDKLLKMDIGFEFELLKGRYDYIVKLVFQNIRGRIKALAENIRAVINITFNTTNYTLVLNKFDLQVPSRIKVTVENKDGSIDWINTIIVNIIAPFFKETITSTVRKEASNAIQTYFNEINHKIAPRKTSAQILNQLLNQSITNGHQMCIR
ncbi:uncharacterized protein LOC126854267 isoform X2 [Cataglyphis hispanica]|uniref:uncharacterized protein LOC126854267 isoform X2 n=1 Tax=Cataglyphis hispanica TaxID=1086592 RepID=UPI00217F3DDE|nr:uncharacterized protein LOC126854267 isoform X2 [Cataglyphis hispanica]XP_050456793.1 uncharacterized protein LOC126854267 isoform X2 [Cataglyphis hispanica]XP_050456794.1 uncharacterized protein LOC126854267 isoform X2 [Cataglyphis hispanica]XP_050456795.1 uncharacterized protein LOC126854267 isoform X2 [Cataglyphis hispanica]XP_050456796.1 uncharacterized protein LOC126854267 isoform X2 [Cataglyphis hispanica]XP_050456797.1 uncharacterized protein LOC126854267 isoform X2 [Cataglyphis hisp